MSDGVFTRPLSRRAVIGLIALGLVLRIPGIFVNGMNDVFEMVLDWGADVHALGLGRGFSVNYGALSFALFGLSERVGEMMPRYWWLPFKVVVILFELGVVLALLRLCRPALARLLLVAYWLNPWFIWHGAYQGFWEGPHVLLALVACLVLAARRKDAWAWGAAGACLCLSWQSKPQGLFHFAAALGLYLAFCALRGRRAPFVAYCAGFAAMTAAVALGLWAAGGSFLALWHNFRSSANDVYLSHGGPGLWRFVYFVYMQIKGVSGEVYTYRPPLVWAIVTTGAALAASLAILALALERLARAEASPAGPGVEQAYLALTIGAFVMALFAPRAHINHAYGAMVLLIPLLPGRARLTTAWIVSAVIFGYAHFSRYGMGSGILPPPGVIDRYGHANAVAEAVRALPAFTTPDVWMRVQSHVNAFAAWLPGQAFVSILSLVVAVASFVMLAELFSMARTGRVWALRASERQSGDA